MAKATKRRNNKNKKRNSTRKGRAPPSIDIKSIGQMPALKDILGKNIAVMVFVYADWCGHCQRFKPDWKSLAHLPSRNVPMVSIRDDVFPKSPLNNIMTIDGYPTVAVVNTAENIAVNVENREKSTLSKLLSNNSNLSVPPPPPPGTGAKRNNKNIRSQLNSLQLNNNSNTIINKYATKNNNNNNIINNNENDSPVPETSPPAKGLEDNEVEMPPNEMELNFEQNGGGDSGGLLETLKNYTGSA